MCWVHVRLVWLEYLSPNNCGQVKNTRYIQNSIGDLTKLFRHSWNLGPLYRFQTFKLTDFLRLLLPCWNVLDQIHEGWHNALDQSVWTSHWSNKLGFFSELYRVQVFCNLFPRIFVKLKWGKQIEGFHYYSNQITRVFG